MADLFQSIGPLQLEARRVTRMEPKPPVVHLKDCKTLVPGKKRVF